MKKYLAIGAALVCVLGAFALGRWMGLRQERDSFQEKRTAICSMGMEYTLESFRSFLDTGDEADYWEGARWFDRFLFAYQELYYGESDDVVYTYMPRYANLQKLLYSQPEACQTHMEGILEALKIQSEDFTGPNAYGMVEEICGEIESTLPSDTP